MNKYTERKLIASWISTVVVLLFLAFLLTGCGSSDDAEDGPLTDPPNWTGNKVEENDNFIVNYDIKVIEGPLMEMIENEWRAVQVCMGLPTELMRELIIEYVKPSEIQDSYTGYIVYRWRYIRVWDRDLPFNHTLRHEFVHYILWTIGVNSSDHESQFFTDCVYFKQGAY